MSIYDEMRAIAAEIMPEFKQGSIFFVPMVNGSGPAHDPGEPSPGQPVALSGSATGVNQRFVDGTKIFASDSQVTFPATECVPEISGYILINSVRYKIIEIIGKPLADPVAYTVIVRR